MSQYDPAWHRFRQGDLVICINDKPFPGAPPGHIRAGRIYTVAAVSDHKVGEQNLRLEEVPTPGRCSGYMAFRFRPVDTSRLDVFRTALNTVPLEKVGLDVEEGCRP